MRAIYCRSSHPGALLIRIGDGMRQWSHVAGLIDAENVIECRAFHGVVITPLADVIRRSSEYTFVERPLPDEAAGLAWAMTTVGKSYDWRGAMGVPFNRPWTRDDFWFCSHHVEMWHLRGGLVTFHPSTRGVGPNTSYSVLRPGQVEFK